MRILAVIDHYLPGYKAGGPIRTVANMVEWLGAEFQFYVVTSDRDWGARHSYPGIRGGGWRPVGKAQVLYLSPQEMRLFAWKRLLRSLHYDLIYLNSFFSPLSRKTLLLRRIGQISERPVVLAPRGEFSPGALSLKGLKKRLYISLVKHVGLCSNIIWQASSEYEMQDILSVFNSDIKHEASFIWVAPNLPPRLLNEAILRQRPAKKAGSARILFLSRIARKKNLDLALRLLANVSGKVQFDIYGPTKDKPYWQECQNLIRQLPPVVQAEYKGAVVPNQVMEIFSQYHLFLFPTRGENFGHVILEALRAGCPVLISDQTPWRSLEETKAGWDLPLSEPERFYAALGELISMDNLSFEEWSRSARKYAEEFVKNPALIAANRELFLKALEG